MRYWRHRVTSATRVYGIHMDVIRFHAVGPRALAEEL